MLSNKTVVLGITGGIAAYKAADIASKLTQAGARVLTVMTQAATQFITPLTLRSLTHKDVVSDMFDFSSGWITHISLAEAADVVVVAPATANSIAKFCHGIADDILSATILATLSPVIIAPAMNVNMFQNAATQENLAKLKERGFIIVGPACGRLASGKVGLGRLEETGVIVETVSQVLGRNGDLAGRRLVVSAGGTREPIDPVRHIGNRSSGKMGYAIAMAARDRGAQVRLVSAATALPDPTGIDVTHVETALQMKAAIVEAVASADGLIMAAAVADYQSKEVAQTKIKKATLGPNLTLELVRTPDIISEVAGNFIRVGFAAESENVVANAREKMVGKQLDIIVANDITRSDSGFATDTNKVAIITRDGEVADLPLMSKREVADRLLDRVVALLAAETAT